MEKTKVNWNSKYGGLFEVKLSPMDCIYLDKIVKRGSSSREEVLEDIITETLYEYSKDTE